MLAWKWCILLGSSHINWKCLIRSNQKSKIEREKIAKMNQQQQWQWLWQWQQKYNICWLALENPTGNECIGSLVVHCSQVVVAQWLSKCVSVCLKPNGFFAYMFSVCLLFFQCKHRWLQHNIYFIYKHLSRKTANGKLFLRQTLNQTRQFI